MNNLLIEFKLRKLTVQLVGSSLLLMHDNSGATGVWMIDFTKTFSLPPPIKKLTHRLPWKFGNHEDGYLFGLDNLITVKNFLETSLLVNMN